MSNLLLLPVILPFVIGTILILFSKYHFIQRFISAVAVIVLMISSLYLAVTVYQNEIITLNAGGWEAPYGIVLVGDMLSTLMVALAGLIGTVCLFFSFTTVHPEREKYYFYPFFFFLLTGVNGSFLTGDLFNLFVFFEVMLVASYALMVIGGTRYQLRETFKYAIINLIASMVFLAAIAYLYGITGTVNMAQAAQRVSELEQNGTMEVIAVLFFIAFATKAALFPLYFWLPRPYFGAPMVITALFGGLLTKVGMYALIRMFTLIFIHDLVFTHYTVMLTIAGLTMVLGVLGAVAQFDFKKILSYHIISQMGYMVMGLGLFTTISIAGAVYFMAHNIIVKTGLILCAGATKKVAGETDLKKLGGVLKTHPVLAWSFLILGLSIAGIPPLSGFFGKFPLIVATVEEGSYLLTFLSLFVGMLTLFSMIKIFLYGFWGRQNISDEQASTSIRFPLLAIFPLVLATLTIGIFAEPFYIYSEAIAEELLDPAIYIKSVLGE